MKKNYLIYILVAVLVGFISAEVIYDEYNENLDDTEFNAYLIQIGSYSENDEEVDASKYLVLEENGRYNVYAGITSTLSNASKIKEVYAEEDIEGYIKPVVINNIEFMSNLRQFDILLSEVDDNENLKSINDVIISRYEEIVLGK